jgi:hypothetical protein
VDCGKVAALAAFVVLVDFVAAGDFVGRIASVLLN